MRARARARSRGATLVEAALIAPLLFGFLFAIIDFSGLLFDSHIVRSGTNNAAREIAVADLEPPDCSLDGIPPATSDETKKVLCTAQANIGRSAAEVQVGVDADTTSETIKVCVEYPKKSLSGVTAPFIENGPDHASDVQIQVEKPMDLDPDDIDTVRETGLAACAAKT